MSGSKASGSTGNYGQQGISAQSNMISGRFGTLGWADLNDNVWIFCGTRSSGKTKDYSDMNFV
jgi:hypothetical protein